jgi:GH15 family glucan-1,4-alpha-glucosidase
MTSTGTTSTTASATDAPSRAAGLAEAPDDPPAISDYGLLSDCHSVALVSRRASIDWYCTPRIDSAPVFGRLLDAERGGSCRLHPVGDVLEADRRYLDRTMVLETRLRTASGTLLVRDLLAMRAGGRSDPRRHLIRVATCEDGEIDVACELSARFDFGMIPPWVRDHGDGDFTLVGGATGLAVWSDLDLALGDRHDIIGACRLTAGETRRLVIATCPPELLDDGPIEIPTPELVDTRVEESIDWWHRWCDARDGDRSDEGGGVLRSALALKSLTHAPTGAIAAAATTSLPEIPGGSWNWDYRFSWIRDSWMTVRSLAEAGFTREATGFQRFVERSAAGSGDELQLLYGVDGRHRTPEVELEAVAGHRGARPVREGNAAQSQLQLDMYGYLLELSWRRLQDGSAMEPSYRRFVAELVDTVCRRWREPDHGIWELRGDPAHYVYSKVLCWTAIDRGIRLAEQLEATSGDVDRWRTTRDQIRATVLDRGVRDRDGAFTAVLDGATTDASLLLLPEFGFVAPDDERMVATVDAVIEALDDAGLIRRFPHGDGHEPEGCFVACTFWLVERLHDLGRLDEARRYFDRAGGTANDLGLFAEEFDPGRGEALGNFPQALSHLAHIGAAVAFERGHSVVPTE